MKTIKIGLVGFGKIGSAVAGVIGSRRAYLRDKSGIDLKIISICDKDIKTKRAVKIDKKLLTRSIGRILYHPNIDIVIELMGGIHPAKDLVTEALRQGKHVVTANKALLSDSGAEIFGLANSLGLCVGFEASVGGGIPIIRALKEGFVANKTELIYGIINGTSNFVLSKMAEDGLGFKEAIRIAQAKGYAERDPYLDISGGDSAHKLSVLALLGFGVAVKPEAIYTEGISDIDPSDMRYAAEMGYAVKLLAIAKKSGDLIELRVHPTLISRSHLLAGVNGVYNAIFVKGDLTGENLFYGEGAGSGPTSSAVVSDVIAIAKNISGSPNRVPCVTFKKIGPALKDISDVKTRYYIRFSALDKTGVLAKISGVLAKYRISIASVTQKGKKSEKMVPIVMMTHMADERGITKALKEIDDLRIIKKKSVRIRIEG